MRSFLSPINFSNSLSECFLLIISSLSPDMNRIDLFLSVFAILFSISRVSTISQEVLLMMSLLTQQNTHGKKHKQRQCGTYGICCPDSLQSLLRSEKGESATMTLHQLLMRRLTEPILLPHPTTSYPFSLIHLAATSTSVDSCTPSVIHLPSRIPHPSKSKQASPTPAGSDLTKIEPSSLLELLQWRYSTTYRTGSAVGRYSESQNGMLCTQYLQVMLYGDRRRERGSYNSLGGRISIKERRYSIPLGQNYWQRMGFDRFMGDMAILFTVFSYSIRNYKTNHRAFIFH